MIYSRFYLDTRRAKVDALCVLKIAINHKGKSALISLESRLRQDQWDNDRGCVVNHPNEEMLNLYLIKLKQQVDSLLLRLAIDGKTDNMTVGDLKTIVDMELNPHKAATRKRNVKRLFAARFKSFAQSKRASTCRLYMATYRRMQAYAGRKFEQLAFEDITKEWLTGFDTFLSATSPSKNARNIHLRNIRAVFNEAIDDEITSFYPFRRFKIRNTATRKRNLKVEDLRAFFNCPCDKNAQRHLDIFKLMFMLIGINLVDLCNLKEIDDEGRVTFYRAKTHRLYSIKVEDEAREIIEKYRGKKYLIDILDRYKDYHDYCKRINLALKHIGPYERKGRGGKKTVSPMFPGISTYWARHSWATIAASLDIPRDTIAHALGHGNNTVTDIYIDFDERKVDEANRRVLDWVLYGKR